MQKLLKGTITKKIILVLTVAILCNFVIPNYSQADAGILLDPIKMFVAFVGDAVISGINMCFTGQWIGASDSKATPASGVDVDEWKKHWAEGFGNTIDWPTILVTPEEIFSGKVLGLNVNFLREIGNDYEDIGNNNGSNIDGVRESLDISTDNPIGTQGYKDALTSLRTQIAKWYNLIRNLCAAALFCVLIYIGIRMTISSISEERAKYKSMMVNWIVAICLVFFLHYIMAVIMFVTEKSVEIIGSGLNSTSYTIKRPGTDVEENFVIKTPAEIGGNGTGATDYDEGSRPAAKVYNLMELTRVYASLENRGLAFAYLLVYLVLVVYTVIFIFKYLKRFMYMAFLTLIAPVIALTYPIDKMGDGRAQAFNKWLTEYLFNALLQPLHLLIYIVLIGTAIELVQVNFIYTIVALAFINQAEKILKEFFGLNKASTAGGTGAFAKGAIASQALSKIKSAGSTAKSLGSKSSGRSGGSGSSNSKPRQAKGLETYIGSNDKEQLNKTGKMSKSTENISTGGAEEEIGPWSKTKISKEEYQEKYGSSVPWKLDNGEDNNNGNMNSAGEKRGLNQSKVENNVKSLQQKRKIKAPGNYNKTRRGAIAGMAKNAGKTLGKGAWKAVKYTGKKVGRGAIRTAAAIPGALLGGAMSIATGNTSYLAAGVGAGALLGGKAADAIGKAPKSIRSAYRQERLGSQGAAGRERYEEFKKSKENINYFKEEYGVGSKQAKAMIEQGREFIEAGYTNPEDVKRLMDMQEASGDATSSQIMAADQMASQLKMDDFLDSKKSAQLEENLANQMKTQAKGKISDERAKQLARSHMNSMRVSKGLAPVTASSSKKVPIKKVQNPNITKTKKISSTQGKALGTKTSSRTSSNTTKRRKNKK